MAFVLSLLGLIRGQDKRAAIWGLVLSGLMAVLFFGVPLLLNCLF